MFKANSRPIAAALALTMGLTGAAQAGPLNIWSASRQQAEVSTPSVEEVQYRRYHRHRYHRHHRHNGISPGAAAAIGIGAIAAGAMIASQRDRYYDDDYYYDEGPGYGPRSDYCDNSNKPKHYPAPAGC
jgi:hypothetical protein